MPRQIAQTPVRMINRYGKDVLYTRESEGVYNPATSSVERPVGITSILKAYKTLVSYREAQSPNLIGKDSAVFLIAGLNLGFIPQINDKISDDSNYQVLMISEVQVNDITALWRLVCVRS